MPYKDPLKKKEYHKKYIRKHYKENKEYYISKAQARNKLLRNALRKFTDRYKVFCGCKDCGYKENPLALQFDHVNGDKIKEVSTMVSQAYSLESIKEEIRKCEVRCANCHMIRTFSVDGTT